jgi:hypothetical protein
MNYDPSRLYSDIPFGFSDYSSYMQCGNCDNRGNFFLCYSAGGIGLFVCTVCNHMQDGSDVNGNPSDVEYNDELLQSDSSNDIMAELEELLCIPGHTYQNTYQRCVHVNERFRAALRKDPKIPKEHRANVKQYHEILCTKNPFYKMETDQKKFQKTSIQFLLRFIDEERDSNTMREQGLEVNKKILAAWRKDRKFEYYGTPSKNKDRRSAFCKTYLEK